MDGYQNIKLVYIQRALMASEASVILIPEECLILAFLFAMVININYPGFICAHTKATQYLDLPDTVKLISVNFSNWLHTLIRRNK